MIRIDGSKLGQLGLNDRMIDDEEILHGGGKVLTAAGGESNFTSRTRLSQMIARRRESEWLAVNLRTVTIPVQPPRVYLARGHVGLKAAGFIAGGGLFLLMLLLMFVLML